MTDTDSDHTLSSGPDATQWSQESSTPALAPGDVFGDRFEIQRLIGQGGMGAVYLAHDRNTAEDVCLKLIRPQLMSQPGAIERFREEGKLARRLVHQGVVRVFDLDQRDGLWFISMEYVPGQSLREWMNSRVQTGKRVSVAEALWIAKEVLDVLEYAHQTLVHRDIKPENILLSGEPRQPEAGVKLLDFGIARAAEGPQLTQTGSMLGSPAYMAPEQEQGREPDARTDVYAVAVVLYEMLTGALPKGRWPHPSDVNEDSPRPLDGLLESALSPVPGKRPSSAAAFASSISKVNAKVLLNALKKKLGLGVGNLETEASPTTKLNRELSRYIQQKRDNERDLDWLERVEPDAAGVIRPLAESGDAVAQFVLGLCYYHGVDVGRSLKRAVSWYRKAADQGEPDALTRLGLCYLRGRGVTQDTRHAVQCFQRASLAGINAAKSNLAWCYEHGLGIRIDVKKAHRLYLEAAQSGWANAQANLARTFAEGIGTDVDLSRAEEWYRKAANNGHKKAKAKLEKLVRKRRSERQAISSLYDGPKAVPSKTDSDSCPECGSNYSFRRGKCGPCGYGKRRSVDKLGRDKSQSRSNQLVIIEHEENGSESEAVLDLDEGDDAFDPDFEEVWTDTPDSQPETDDFSTFTIVVWLLGAVLAVLEHAFDIPYLLFASLLCFALPFAIALIVGRADHSGQRSREGDLGCSFALAFLYLVFLFFRFLYRLL